MAMRVVVPIAPLALVPATTGMHPTRSIVFGIVLFVAAVFLRWRDRVGVEVVRDGLVLGLGAMGTLFALQLGRYDCCRTDGFAGGAAVSLLTAIVAVVGIRVSGVRAVANTDRLRRAVLVLLVAALAAYLGSLGLPARTSTSAVATSTGCSTMSGC
jgi:hypothetical protein